MRVLCRRRVGAGEREHVRTQVLNVLLVSCAQPILQISAALRAADNLKMKLRLHYNFTRLSENDKFLSIKTFQHAIEHSFREHSKMSQDDFRKMLSQIDIVVQILDAENFNAALITDSIIDCWEKTGKRFLNGNFAFLADDMIQRMYSDFYWDSTDIYKEFCSEDPVS